ncbi:Uncharacterised protein [Porphyromonas crevioricanis]|uniref:Uncharacterized protein n=2 Tax=Porphyromonas crevioricanis TaxID=393921 RepID=A0A2X4PI16_9PORP|nr:hypothetical protein [Porphyromonas crevioricanis]SQH72300.1 Uncharacterised protein [Porphyromonas crevioricanis]
METHEIMKKEARREKRERRSERGEALPNHRAEVMEKDYAKEGKRSEEVHIYMRYTYMHTRWREHRGKKKKKEGGVQK